MDIQLRPDFQAYVDDQVRVGRFDSVREALEAGVARLMDDERSLTTDEEEKREIEEALEEAERGESLDWAAVEAQLRAKHLNP